VTGRETALTIAAVTAAIAFAVTRTAKGQAVATDAVAGVITAGGVLVDRLTPRGIRNNNPGNIDWIPNIATRWRGMIRKETASDVPAGVTPRFGVFDTAANGWRALGGELGASIKKGQTIEQAIHEWAPPAENDTGAYVRVVADRIGAAPSTRLSTWMILPAGLAICQHEQGIQPYAVEDVAAWIAS
jgi:hypothetical protein